MKRVFDSTAGYGKACRIHWPIALHHGINQAAGKGAAAHPADDMQLALFGEAVFIGSRVTEHGAPAAVESGAGLPADDNGIETQSWRDAGKMKPICTLGNGIPIKAGNAGLLDSGVSAVINGGTPPAFFAWYRWSFPYTVPE